MDVDGKVVVITGGSTGIGRATAQLLGERGAKLVLASRRAQRLDETVGALRERGADVIGVPTDIGDLAAVERLADAAYGQFGCVDIGFFNAGIPGTDRLIDPNLAAWHAAVDTNLFGLLHCIKAFLPRMVAQGTRCSVLATTSGAGIHGTTYQTSTYAATKNAQLTIMECLYGQVRDEGLPVHVGVVVPPLTRTNLAGDDLSIWSVVEDGLKAAGRDAALVEPGEFALVIADGIEAERFWIEIDDESDRRYLDGRTAGARASARAFVDAKAAAMNKHTEPDSYLW